MPTLKELQENTDEIHNPSSEAARSLVGQEQSTGKNAGINAGVDQAAAFANDPKNASSKNISDAKDRENQFGYEKSGTTAKSPQSFTFKGLVTSRKSATGGIIGAILALVGGIGFITTPGLAAVQMKEILTDDLNDQLAAMDIRSTYVMRAKLKDMGTGICAGGVQIRCGFKGMSDRQIAKFKKAGIEVNIDENAGKTFGKNKVTSLSFTDSKGNKIVVNNVRELNRRLGDRIVRTAFRKAINPKFMGFYDAKWDGVMRRLGISKANKIVGDTDEARNQSVDEATKGAGTQADLERQRALADKDASQEEIDKNNTETAEADRQAGVLSSGGQSTDSLFENIAKNGATSAVKGLLITGAIDTACTVKNTARAVEAGAKTARLLEFSQYASVFLTLADRIKAGEATPEEVEWAGDRLTAIDTREKIISERSVVEGNSATYVDNPDYGKSAFDSSGYKVAMYNEAPTLSARDMDYTVGGGALMGTLAGINSEVSTEVGDKTCDVVQSNVVRFGSLLAGIAIGIGSFGISTAAIAGLSLSVGMLLPLLENYLAQMIAGSIVGSSTKGVGSGNAIFAGTAGMLSAVSMSRGMKPANKADLQSYLALNESVRNEYVAIETEDARNSPTDITNRYSFAGSLARTMLPLQTTSSISLGNSIMNSLGVISNAATSFTPAAMAKNGYNEERFSKCADEGYDDLGIDADVFCNVRFVLSEKELALDTDEVIAWMNGDNSEGPGGTPMVFVSDNGSPQDDYVDWLEECVNRTTGLGSALAGQENGGEGKRCMSNDMRSSYFRIYTMDQSIIEGFEYEPPTGVGGAYENTGAGVTFTLGTYNLPTDKGQRGRDTAIRNITTRGVDVVGMQEQVRENYPDMQRKFKQNGYGLYPDYKPGTNAQRPCSSSQLIAYDKEKFDFVKAEIFDYPRYPDRATKCDGEQTKTGRSNAPVVWLEAKDTGQTVIVINIHNAANVPVAGNTNPAVSRYQAAKIFIEQITRLQKENPGIPVFLTGDFNEGTGVRPDRNRTLDGDVNNLLFCMFAKNKLMKSAGGPKMACGGYGIGGVDYIYIRPDVKVDAFNELSKEQAGSDHPFLYSRLTVPAGKDSGAVTTDGWAGNASEQGFQWPSQKGTISNCFAKPGHTGIDIATATGTKVYAAKGGLVRMASSQGDAGNVVMIKHENGLWTNYQHNSEILVKFGDTVKRGDVVALSGNTGYSKGDHIHFSVTNAETLSSRTTGTNTLNPIGFLPAKPTGISGGC